MSRPFSDSDADWVRAYVGQIDAAIRPRIEAHASRFPDAKRLFARLANALEAVLVHGWAHMSSIDEAHNELCVAVAILDGDPGVSGLRYEPPLQGTNRTIDFVAFYGDRDPGYVDAKTIAPRTRDRWEQFAKAQADGWLPPQATVTLLKDWLGGPLWHNMVAARSRMLEYTIALESKVAAADLATKASCIIMVFCSNGFHWHLDELEDFVAFYVSGRHRPDDHFAQMEMKQLAAVPLPANRAVRQFGYLERTAGALLPHRGTWSVQPPPLPFGK